MATIKTFIMPIDGSKEAFSIGARTYGLEKNYCVQTVSVADNYAYVRFLHEDAIEAIKRQYPDIIFHIEEQE